MRVNLRECPVFHMMKQSGARTAIRMEQFDNALEKGLRILELLNDHVSVRVRDLHEWTGLPKPTIVRILNTLQSMGYVRRLSRAAGYSVSSRVIALSSGFHGVPRIVEHAAPHLDALTRRLLWPASLASLDFDAMVVRYSTIPMSPYSHRQSTIQRRLSLSLRAHGRAYLAFCPRAELESLLRPMPEDVVAHLRQQLPLFRRQGWATRHPAIDPQTNSIAVPLFGPDRRLQGTIGFTFFRRSLSHSEEKALAGELKAAAGRIMAEAA